MLSRFLLVVLVTHSNPDFVFICTEGRRLMGRKESEGSKKRGGEERKLWIRREGKGRGMNKMKA